MSPTAITAKTRTRARDMRRASTQGEKRLWQALRQLRQTGVHVRRQAPIGPYIVDFAILKQRLIIEIDGDLHAESRRAGRDRARDAWFQREGFRVLRFSVHDLDETFDGVVEDIMRKVGVL